MSKQAFLDNANINWQFDPRTGEYICVVTIKQYPIARKRNCFDFPEKIKNLMAEETCQDANVFYRNMYFPELESVKNDLDDLFRMVSSDSELFKIRTQDNKSLAQAIYEIRLKLGK